MSELQQFIAKKNYNENYIRKLVKYMIQCKLIK